jgi:hypothetical protein
MERHLAEILAVEREKVLGDQARVSAGVARAQGVEVRASVFEEAHGLAVKGHVLDRQARHRGADQWEVGGPIPSGAGPQVQDAVLASRDDAIAVPLEFMK